MKPIYALILTALVALPTVGAASAAGTTPAGAPPVDKKVARIETALGHLDNMITRVETKIDKVEDRLAAAERERQRQRLEAEQKRLQEAQARLEQAKQAALEKICADPVLVLQVKECGFWD
jgi:uncharacterized protein (DUF3084 family)